MTTGANSRQPRSAAEEGPTIYKCDQLRSMLEAAIRNRSKRHSTTDPVKFLGGYLPVRTDANGKSRTKGDEDENPNTARFHSFCTQLARALGVTKEFIVERITQGLLHDESQLRELCDHLTAASEHYKLAMSVIKDEPLNRPVTIRIGTTNLINMRVLPIVLESVRQKFRAAYPDVQLRFVQTIMDSDELLGTQPPVGVDAIVACCLDTRAGKIPATELAASMPLRCCLLRQRDSESRESSGAICLPNWEALRGTDMVALATRHKHFDIPWSTVEQVVETIEEVPTLLEAHARVAASDAWTLSYRELMDDVDERTLEILDLPVDLERQVPLIVAVLPSLRRRKSRVAAKATRHTAVEKQTALKILKECLQVTLEQKQKIRREAEQMTHWLTRFPYSYHVSDYSPKRGDKIRRVWFAGRASLECTANGNLSGALTIGNPNGESLYVRVFGRPIGYHEGAIWHLHWRGLDPREVGGTTNVVATTAELKDGEHLVGSWVGRSSWIDGDVRPSGGPFILHTRGDLTPTELRQLVTSHEEKSVPDLRQLSNELVPVTQRDGRHSIH